MKKTNLFLLLCLALSVPALANSTKFNFGNPLLFKPAVPKSSSQLFFNQNPYGGMATLGVRDEVASIEGGVSFSKVDGNAYMVKYCVRTKIASPLSMTYGIVYEGRNNGESTFALPLGFEYSLHPVILRADYFILSYQTSRDSSREGLAVGNQVRFSAGFLF